MKLETKKELTTLDGKPMKMMMLSEVVAQVITMSNGATKDQLAKSIVHALEREEDITQNATVGMVIFNSLLAETEGEAAAKYKRGRLAEKIYGAEEVEITLEEATLIKDIVGKTQNSTTIVRIWDILEGK